MAYSPKLTQPDLPKEASPLKSRSLSLVMRTYKGLGDFHIALFRAVKSFTKAEHVLYPGCHRHVQASLVFPKVVYIDTDKKVEAEFSDAAVLEWLRRHKFYPDTVATRPNMQFLLRDFTATDLPLSDGSFELLISMSAGIVSSSCAKYLRSGGFFLVSDAHFDARETSLHPEQFRLRAVYDLTEQRLKSEPEALEGHFHTQSGRITEEQVQQSIELPKARRKFKLMKEALFYLFEKL